MKSLPHQPPSEGDNASPGRPPCPEPRPAEERPSEVVLRSVHVDSPHATILLDDQARVVALNAHAARLFRSEGADVVGRPAEDLLGIPVAALMADCDCAEVADRAEAPHGSLSVLARRLDGSTFPANITAAHIYSKAQRVTIVHVCDDSARTATETRLKQLSTALEQIDDHAVITDNDGRILYVNRAFEEVSGYPRSELLGKTMSIVKSGKHDAAFYAELWKTIRSGAVFRGEIVNRNSRGDLYFDDQRIAPFTVAASGEMYFIATGRDVTEQRLRDPLTGLPTRAALTDRIAQALARVERAPADSHCALVFVDIDRFQSVNDAHGMLIGDAVLVEIAQRIRHTVRKVDSVAQVSHLDRDEFAVLLEDLKTVEHVRRVALRLVSSIHEPILLPNGSSISVTASIGIAAPTAGHSSPEALLQDAETAMRRAKACPNEPCQVFDPAMHERVRNRLLLESELRAALSRDEFVLHFQPIVSLASGKITSCEALVRWNHPTRGFVPPLEFIGIAEETGLIVPLGNWVLRMACTQARCWQAMGFPNISVAVNVSPRQLTEGQLIDAVDAALKATELDPNLLKIEITESAAASNPESAAAVLRSLKELGVQLLIDDFGTGYSSLSRLTRFPIHKLKIDRSFVMNIPDNGHDTAVASTIVAMAHSLGLGVIAEGVETHDQAAFLRFIGCEEMQGYLFSKPVNAAEFANIVRSGRQLETPISEVPPSRQS